MKYSANINGLVVDACFSEYAVQGLFVPLLQRLADLHAQKQARVLAMLAAPPGAGKSTLVSFLEFLAKETVPDKTVQAIGMTAFIAGRRISSPIRPLSMVRRSPW